MRSPFKFLDAYTAKDKKVFFGRQKEIDALYNMVYKTPLVMVYGLSGTGKTSLVQCGLSTRFDGPDWLPFLIRKQDNINAALRKQLNAELELKDRTDDLNKIIERLFYRYFRPVYLLFDQFEELFILGEPEEQQQFMHDIQRLQAAELPCRVVLILREEYIGQLYDFEKVVPTLFDYKLRVEPMTNKYIRDVMEQSFEAFNITLEPPADIRINQIIEKLSSGRSNIPLPYLQVYLDMLYREDYARTYGNAVMEEALPPLQFTKLEIDEFGQIDDVLSRFLRQKTAEIQMRLSLANNTIPKDTVKRVLDAFVTEEGTKRPVYYQRNDDFITIEKSIRESLDKITDDTLHDCLSELEDTRILRFRDDTIELAHDTLAALIDQLRTTQQRALNEMRRQIKSSFGVHQKTGDFLTLGQLELYLPHLSDLKLNKEFADFIQNSQHHHDRLALLKEEELRQEKELRQLAEREKQKAIDAEIKAKKQTSIARANELAFTAQNLLRSDDRTKAFQLAAFAHDYIDHTNLKVGRMLHYAFYYNDHPDRQEEKSIFRQSWNRNFFGHTADVSSVSFSPNGQFVLTASGDHTAKMWNARTGEEIHTFTGHTGAVTSALFSPNGRLVLTSSGDGTARLWDAEMGDAIRSFEGHTSQLNSAAFSPDGRYVLTTSSDKSTRLWDADTGELIRIFRGHSSIVTFATFSPDGKYVLMANRDKVAKLSETETGAEIRTFKGHSHFVTHATFSSDGQFILTASWDKTVRMWDAVTGAEVRVFRGHESYVTSAVFSPSGRHVLTAGGDRTVRIWNARTGEAIRIVKGHSSAVNAAEYSPDGRSVLTGSDDRTVRMWRAETHIEIKTFSGQKDQVTSANFLPGSQYLLTATGDKTAKVWDTRTGTDVYTFEGLGNSVLSAIFSRDGRFLLTASGDKVARMWNAETGTPVRDFVGHDRAVTEATFSSDGKLVLTASADKTARIWNASTGNTIRVLSGHEEYVTSAIFSPDDQFVLTASGDKTARMWNVQTGEEIRRFKGHSHHVTSAAFSPKGKFILTASGDVWGNDKSAKLWNAETGTEMRTFKGHDGGVTSAVFSPDGNYVLTASRDTTARIWDVVYGTEIKVLRGHSDVVTSASYSPDGNQILTRSEDKTTKLWIVNNAALRKAPPPLASLTPEDIQRFQLYDLLQKEDKWEYFLEHAEPLQIYAFGLYLSEQVAYNNNPVVFNEYYTQAARCFYITANTFPHYNTYLADCYQAWAHRLFENGFYEQAKDKVILAESLTPEPENQVLLQAIEEALKRGK